MRKGNVASERWTILAEINERNNLVHMGKLNMDNYEIQNGIRKLKDLMHVFDFLKGSTWLKIILLT